MQTPTAKRPRGHYRLFPTADDLQKAVDGYWAWLETQEREIVDKRGVASKRQYPAYWGRLLLHIGASYESISPYVDGEYDDDNNNYSDILARAKQRVEALTAEGAMTGDLNDRAAALVLQARHDLTPKTEQIVSGSVVHQLDDAAMDRLWAARQSRLSAGDGAITVQAEVVELCD